MHTGELTPWRRTAQSGTRGRRLRLDSPFAPALVHSAGQVLTLLVVAQVAAVRRRPLGESLSSWDGLHFLAVAEHGYGRAVDVVVPNSVAFFPGYPTLIRAAHTSTGLGWLATALSISMLSGVVTAYGLVRLVGVVCVDRTDHRRIGLILVALTSTGPLSVVLAMAYSEALFCALAVWALVFMSERRWWAAAILVVIAGTVRQTALALVVALAVAVTLAAIRGRADLRAWAALVTAPCGALAYLWWADQHTGVRGSWFAVEARGWGARLDLGRATADWAWQALTTAPALLEVATVAVIVAAIVLLATGLRRWPVVWAYCATVVALDVLSAGIMNSKVRLFLPAMPLLLPLAIAVRDQPRRRRVALLGAWAAVGCWYSAYALIIYGYAI